MAQTLQMEQLVRELNDPRNQGAPEAIDEIQRQIQRLQREPSAWNLGLDLLHHDEAVMRFYGALTLTIKINADWDVDKVGEDRSLVNHLLESLISSYVRLASISDVPFVLQKLCTTLVAVFQKPQSAWALPVRHLVACTVAGRYIFQDEVPGLDVSLNSQTVISSAQLRSLLLFPITLAEQETAISGSVKEQNVRVRISNNVSDILGLLHFATSQLVSTEDASRASALQVYKLSVHLNDQESVELARTILQLLPLWTGDIKIKGNRAEGTRTDPNYNFFEVIVRTLPGLFSKEPLAPAVIHALTAMEESSHKLLQRALPRYEEYIIKSPQATAWLEQLRIGDFDPDAVAYMNFLEACIGQIDVTSPDYLATESYIEILKQVRMLLQCEGAPGVDDTVCQVALEILTSVTEGFGDWDGPSEYDHSMKDLVRAACSSASEKIRIPQEELSTKTQTWDADDRAKFQDFRYDVQDYLQNAFGILGDTLIEQISSTIVHAELRSDWNIFEAGLFSLIAFSDVFANEPESFDLFPKAIFDCPKWRMAVAAEVEIPDRVRQVMIKFIGENTTFLQRHTEFLVNSLNFLFTSLHMEFSATAASRAIYTLCDAQRSMLTEALPHFMESLNNTSDIEPDAKHRIYAAVGAIIQAVPSEAEKVQPLAQILHYLLQHEVENSIHPALDQTNLIAKAIDVLQTLAALGRGLRAPTDAPIDLENTKHPEAQFWLTGGGSSVQRRVLQIYRNLLDQSNGRTDPLFIEAACDFIRSGFTEEHPSPFKFSNSQILELLSTYMYSDCLLPDHVMSTASSYLASVKPEESDNEFPTLIMTTVHILNEALVDYKTNSKPLNSEFCAAALDFYTRLLPKWAMALLSSKQAQDVISLIIELALILVEDSDTLPRRTAASFFTAFLEASGQPAIVARDDTATAMSTILQSFGPRIIGSTVRLLGGVCARSDIDSLTETIKKGITRQPLMTNRLIKEAVKDDNAVLTPRALQATKPEQRARFASQIEMLRGARKTNEVIREFWIACRGREFEYVT